jgi:hypothetical protein
VNQRKCRGRDADGLPIGQRCVKIEEKLFQQERIAAQVPPGSRIAALGANPCHHVPERGVGAFVRIGHDVEVPQACGVGQHEAVKSRHHGRVVQRCRFHVVSPAAAGGRAAAGERERAGCDVKGGQRRLFVRGAWNRWNLRPVGGHVLQRVAAIAGKRCVRLVVSQLVREQAQRKSVEGCLGEHFTRAVPARDQGQHLVVERLCLPAIVGESHRPGILRIASRTARVSWE